MGCAGMCGAGVTCVRVCASVHGCARVWEGVHGCARVYAGGVGCARVCTGVRGYAWVCVYMWNEFSEFLLENRGPTSADFNTYPIRIFKCYVRLHEFQIINRF